MQNNAKDMQASCVCCAFTMQQRLLSTSADVVSLEFDASAGICLHSANAKLQHKGNELEGNYEMHYLDDDGISPFIMTCH